LAVYTNVKIKNRKGGKMSIMNCHNNYEVENSAIQVLSDSKMIKVEISKDARGYIFDRGGAITVELRTSFG
jgi:CRISPR/Cas system-associated exonuclease Cas4 (RecB family)